MHYMEWTILHCTALNYNSLHCTALLCTRLHCTALHCTSALFTPHHSTLLKVTATICTVQWWCKIFWSLDSAVRLGSGLHRDIGRMADQRLNIYKGSLVWLLTCTPETPKQNMNKAWSVQCQVLFQKKCCTNNLFFTIGTFLFQYNCL